MTSYYELSTVLHSAFGVCALVLMAAALCILVSACALRLRRWNLLSASVLTAAAFLLLQGIGDVSYCRIFGYTPVYLAKVVGTLPYAVVGLLLLLLAAAEAAALIMLKRRRENMLTPMAPKESLDALPDGICFFAADGQPLLVNTQMNRISGELFHTELLNADTFWRSLKNGEGNAKFLRTAPTVRLQTKDERVWDFRHRLLTVDRSEVQELAAYDVTTLYRLLQELDARNKDLSKVNERLRRYSREVEHITRENEILTAKIRVHDDVGRALLAFRSYLTQPPEERKRDELLLLWRHTAAVLKNGAASEKPRTDWELLLKAAQSVDVEIVQSGELPEDERERAVVIDAVHECLTNTVKHAKGNRLFLTLRTSDAALTVELSNNGEPPAGQIRESGGLLNLRRSVEMAGGRMTTEAVPRFLLRVELPRGGNYGWRR